MRLPSGSALPLVLHPALVPIPQSQIAITCVLNLLYTPNRITSKECLKREKISIETRKKPENMLEGSEVPRFCPRLCYALHRWSNKIVLAQLSYSVIKMLTLETLKYFCINSGDQRVFFNFIMSQAALSASFEYLYYVSSSIVNMFSHCWDRLETSESDVYRRQIPTYKVGNRDERVKAVKCCSTRANNNNCLLFKGTVTAVCIWTASQWKV